MSSAVVKISSSNEDSNSSETISVCNVETDESPRNVAEQDKVKNNKKVAKEPQPTVSLSNVNKCQPESIVLQKSLPEKIIICVDNTCQQTNQIQDVKKAVEIFVRLKNQINVIHQFAIIALNNSVPEWITGFSNNIREIISFLHHIKITEKEDNSYNLNNLFELISNKITEDNVSLDNNYIWRVIILYSRSNCLTEELEQKFSNLFSSHFFVDILSIYENTEETGTNDAKENFNACCNSNSYVFFSENNITEIKNCMAKLLAHPLQRPPLQKNATYTFIDVGQMHDN